MTEIWGVQLRRIVSGGKLHVLVETEDGWRLVVEELDKGEPMDHIIESSGIENAPPDPFRTRAKRKE